MTRPCRRSTWLICISILSIIVLTIISTYYYQNYLLHRRRNLKKLIGSLQFFPSVNMTYYKQFESTVLPRHLTKSIEDYLSTEHDHYLIIECETGLGNRLQSIISAFLMAFLTNRRLLIHWPVTKLSACRFHQLFQPIMDMSSTLLNRYTKDYILDHADYLTFHGPFDELLCHSNLTSFKREFKFLFVSTDEYFLSVLMKNPAYSETLFFDTNEDILFKTLINYLFVPIKELNEKIHLHSSNNGHCDKGIHMRKEGLKKINNNGEKGFLDCILNKTTTSANETWFIASDYTPFKSYIKSHTLSKNITVRSLSSSGDSSDCSDVQQALIELWLLTKCEQLFLTYWSSFSWLASGMSGTHPVIVSANSCHIQPFSRPCYYELTHLKQLSCYNYAKMLRNDGCCYSEKFCDSNCLHHDPKYRSHAFYFLFVWPAWPLFKWLFKWVVIWFLLIFLLNKVKLKWDLMVLIDLYKKMLVVVLFLCLLFVNIRCLFWCIRKIL